MRRCSTARTWTRCSSPRPSLMVALKLSQAAAHGQQDVLVEKPTATSCAGLHDHDRSLPTLRSDQTLRFRGHLARARQLIAAGKVGQAPGTTRGQSLFTNYVVDSKPWGGVAHTWWRLSGYGSAHLRTLSAF